MSTSQPTSQGHREPTRRRTSDGLVTVALGVAWAVLFAVLFVIDDEPEGRSQLLAVAVVGAVAWLASVSDPR